MPFDKFMEQFDPNAEGFDLDAFKQAAIAEAKKDADAIAESANAKIATITGERDSLKETVTRVQSHNYDLLQAVGGKPADAPGTAGDGAGQGPRTFDSLFKKE